MAKQKANVDWSAVTQEKAAGASAVELSRKYGVHVSSIYLHTKGPARVGRGKTPTSARAAVPVRGNLVSTPDLIAQLKKHRDALTEAITALESLSS